MVQALADRFVEAFAEAVHKKIRTTYWGYAPDEDLSEEDLLKIKYQGIRPAAGYPSQPDHTEKSTMWKLLNIAEKTGIELSESLSMMPASSVSALCFGHKQSEYFAVGQITKDHVINDAKGNKIAYVDGQGNLIDAKGKLMGRMGKDGKTYQNVNGDLVFSVKENGTSCNIYDASGKKIGNIHSSYKGMACVLFCFQNDMDMTDHTKMVSHDKYSCPMHPEVTGKEGDICSKCKMKLVKVAKK